MARVLIIGASRGIGLETVRCALAEGHRVRAFARRAASIAIDRPELEKSAGDALDRAAVSQALQDVDAVIEVLGAPKDLRPQCSGARRCSRRQPASSSMPCGRRASGGWWR